MARRLVTSGARESLEEGDLDAFMKDLYRCRDCSLPGPGSPAPPSGRLTSGRRIDVLLVGWNPQIRDYEAEATLPYEQWREAAASGIERASAPFRNLVGRLLPTDLELGDPRVANTRVWKWPSRTKTDADGPRARACAEKHLWREVELLRPRLLLTYDKDAAGFFIDAISARGIAVEQTSRWPSVIGWTGVHRAWGWPMALLAVSGKRDKTHDEVAFIRSKGAELLAACVRAERGT